MPAPIRSVRPLGLLVAMAVGVGCGCAKQAEIHITSDLTFNQASDLDPTHELTGNVSLTQAGSSKTMQVKTMRSDDGIFDVDLMLHGSSYDQEQYVAKAGSFGLITAALETYEPAIPLLKFPMSAGDRWTWEGQARAGSEVTRATADISTSESTEWICGASVDAVKATVDVRLIPSRGAPIEREMVFYFAPGKGLFKREFGTSSIREPGCN